MASAAVLRPAVHDDVEGLLAFDITVVVRTRDDWAAAIDKAARGERLLLVAEVEGVIAAFAQAHRLEQHPDDAAPAGWYLTGVTVLPLYRRAGLARRLTTARLAWIFARADESWYFANAQNTASIDLHTQLGFTEVARAAAIHGVRFDGGEGILFRRGATDPSTFG
ncbi:GNAT family N-acetyltransferase [Aeromicrobium wangtongii]|uniref:GNAT family N-acetyltransferase n=1 Tax=Aeromicrobium wangtongii TaxID=2969247 RepID=A0ABY5MEB3_9ACTN|nr:GNAT family N-acetyltransferase [Aeromicrobium wangtongii]MCD9197581.1 GNAT family N-acetyltransferase [Aeromicrobium wangtongii]UUP15072.1 GNAT family N-acetyltransferase [Aeromicrobium wangtongii]